MQMGLESGSIDAMSLYKSVAGYLMARNSKFELTNFNKAKLSDAFCCAIREEDKELLEKVNGAISSMQQDGTLDRLVKEYITEANEPKAVPALTALKMGTEYGAAALNLDKVGKIEAGYKADIVLYDTTGAHWHPNFNPVSLLIYSANSADTDAVIVDGKVLMENKTLSTIDEEKVYFEVDKCVKRLIG